MIGTDKLKVNHISAIRGTTLLKNQYPKQAKSIAYAPQPAPNCRRSAQLTSQLVLDGLAGKWKRRSGINGRRTRTRTLDRLPPREQIEEVLGLILQGEEMFGRAVGKEERLACLSWASNLSTSKPWNLSTSSCRGLITAAAYPVDPGSSIYSGYAGFSESPRGACRLPQPGQTKPSGQRRLNKNATQLASSENAFWNSESERALAIVCASWRPHAADLATHYI